MRTVPAYALLAAIAFLPSTAFAQEWSGPYGVVSIADDGGSTESFGGGTPIATYGRNGQQGSIAFGYNVQNGNWITCGEFAYSTGQIGLSFRPDLNYLDGMMV